MTTHLIPFHSSKTACKKMHAHPRKISKDYFHGAWCTHLGNTDQVVHQRPPAAQNILFSHVIRMGSAASARATPPASICPRRPTAILLGQGTQRFLVHTERSHGITLPRNQRDFHWSVVSNASVVINSTSNNGNPNPHHPLLPEIRGP